MISVGDIHSFLVPGGAAVKPSDALPGSRREYLTRLGNGSIEMTRGQQGMEHDFAMVDGIFQVPTRQREADRGSSYKGFDR